MRSTSFRSNSPGAGPTRGSRPRTQGVADFLRAHDGMAALLPVIKRLTALEKDCAILLPTVFSACRVLHLEGEQLVLSVPNTALAAKLKQQLPKLQDGLIKRGWQVNAIRLKVQLGKLSTKTMRTKEISFPPKAAEAFSDLDRALGNSKGNDALKAALQTLLQRHKNPSSTDGQI